MFAALLWIFIPITIYIVIFILTILTFKKIRSTIKKARTERNMLSTVLTTSVLIFVLFNLIMILIIPIWWGANYFYLNYKDNQYLKEAKAETYYYLQNEYNIKAELIDASFETDGSLFTYYRTGKIEVNYKYKDIEFSVFYDYESKSYDDITDTYEDK